MAAAALAAYLASQHRPPEPAWTRITIDQGDAMGQPSRLRAAALAEPDGVTSPSVTGQAILTGREELSLSTLGPDLPEPELRLTTFRRRGILPAGSASTAFCSTLGYEAVKLGDARCR